MPDSRQFVPELFAILDRHADGRSQLRAPGPGLWRNAPEPGTLIRPGMAIGELERLGVLHRLRAPEQAEGIVVVDTPAPNLARRPVDHGTLLLTLDPEALVGSSASTQTSGPAQAGDAALVFRSPSAGRFYTRPAPDKPAFVEAGQTVTRSQTIGVLEVMKTFTRIHYDDPRLPERARVVAIVVRDQDEIDSGAVLLQLEAVD
jgi:acetyl-CoA carboxylase biotin carboxyl carrier protein